MDTAISRPSLYLVCGLPGAGKTTRSKAIAAARNAVRLCTDEWLEALGSSLVDYPARFRFEPYLVQHAAQLLRAGASVVVEFATWARKERDVIRDLATGNGARVELHYVDAALGELERRVRERGGPHAQILVEGVLRKLAHQFERPSAEEVATYDRYSGPNDPALP